MDFFLNFLYNLNKKMYKKCVAWCIMSKKFTVTVNVVRLKTFAAILTVLHFRYSWRERGRGRYMSDTYERSRRFKHVVKIYFL